MSNNDISPLTAMGFPEDQAQEALRVSNGNLEHAVNYLLSGAAGSSTTSSVPTTSTTSSLSSSSELIVASTSQYTFPDGRSACTCIALTAAHQCLTNPPSSTAKITEGALQDILQGGIDAYQSVRSNSSSNVEHLSAEEVLQLEGSKSIFPLRLLEGGVRQGMLSEDPHHPLGPMAIFQGIRQDQPPNQWMAVLMTKTPETIVVLLPPPTSSESSFWIVDSHPRSHLGAQGAYAQGHTSLESLVQGGLTKIFPCTSLGPDIPEMMAMMYNSFDLYPLLLR